jgi:mannose-6-phosphate isomerase-like protein (cupin superfamily)
MWESRRGQLTPDGEKKRKEKNDALVVQIKQAFRIMNIGIINLRVILDY